jgi:hypothetical protein
MADAPRTLFQKIWDNHIVYAEEGRQTILYVDLQLVHEVTSAQALDRRRRHDSAQRLRDADWAALARDMFESIELVIMRGVRNEDRALVGAILKGKQAHIWLADGLKKGKAWLNTIVSQDRLPELMKGIPADLREDVQTSLKRRLMFIAT